MPAPRTREEIIRSDEQHGYHEEWRWIRVRKEHECHECGDVVKKGSMALARSSACAPGPVGAPFYDEYLCPDCEWRVDD